MSAWNISAPSELLASLTQSSISKNQSSNFDTSNSSEYAKILAAQLAQVENEFQSSSENSLSQNAATGETSTSNSIPVIETIKRFRPDGTIMLTTYKDGKIDSTQRIKPHLVAVPDFNAPPTPEGKTDTKYVQRYTLAELLML